MWLLLVLLLNCVIVVSVTVKVCLLLVLLLSVSVVSVTVKHSGQLFKSPLLLLLWLSGYSQYRITSNVGEQKSYPHSGSCTPTSGNSVMEFCYGMKLTTIDRNTDTGILTPHTFCFSHTTLATVHKMPVQSKTLMNDNPRRDHPSSKIIFEKAVPCMSLSCQLDYGLIFRVVLESRVPL